MILMLGYVNCCPSVKPHGWCWIYRLWFMSWARVSTVGNPQSRQPTDASEYYFSCWAGASAEPFVQLPDATLQINICLPLVDLLLGTAVKKKKKKRTHEHSTSDNISSFSHKERLCEQPAVKGDHSFHIYFLKLPKGCVRLKGMVLVNQYWLLGVHTAFSRSSQNMFNGLPLASQRVKNLA